MATNVTGPAITVSNRLEPSKLVSYGNARVTCIGVSDDVVASLHEKKLAR